MDGLAHSLSRLGAGRGVTTHVVAPALIRPVVANGYMTNQSILVDGGMHPL